ncbi:MAG: WhiB family transcriptional regulator [Candidatus Parvarchaeum sp.]
MALGYSISGAKVRDNLGAHVWLAKAACKGAPVEDFFEKAEPKMRQVIKKYCNKCRVRIECLEDALKWEAQGNHPYGVVGGTMPAERLNNRATLALELYKKEHPSDTFAKVVERAIDLYGRTDFCFLPRGARTPSLLQQAAKRAYNPRNADVGLSRINGKALPRSNKAAKQDQDPVGEAAVELASRGKPAGCRECIQGWVITADYKLIQCQKCIDKGKKPTENLDVLRSIFLQGLVQEWVLITEAIQKVLEEDIKELMLLSLDTMLSSQCKLCPAVTTGMGENVLKMGLCPTHWKQFQVWLSASNLSGSLEEQVAAFLCDVETL